jgi:Glycosyl hydrolase catalytic core
MTRRQLLAALAASALPLGCKPEQAQPAKPVGKKGLCLTEKKRPSEAVAHFVESMGANWFYNWNIEPPKILPAGVDFTPLVYRVSANLDEQLARVKALAATKGYTELLGFNEPDAKSQGNTSVEAALDAWPKLEATGLRLGSPATVHPDNEWMIAFMKGVEERGLRVDFICMHSYGGPGVESLVKKIEKVHTLFKRPIWITEFAVADWKAKSATENRFEPEKVAEFVTELLPKLEAMEIVERYAWFHGGVSGGPLASSQLFSPDGTPSVVGEAYRSAS